MLTFDIDVDVDLDFGILIASTHQRVQLRRQRVDTSTCRRIDVPMRRRVGALTR